jgi:hypothetical protein
VRGIHWKSWDNLSLSKKKGGMGFRDLAMFNSALLAKQGWRLLQHLDSLVARIMQEKYFPSGDFMQAQWGHNPSYARRSIANSRALLEKGLAWRVGNGESSRIWGDKWILSPSPHHVQSIPRGLDIIARVSSLIDRRTGRWNFPLLHTCFDREEAEQIGTMFLSPLSQPDKLIWSGTKSGLFSVRSAYQLGLQDRAQTVGEPSNAG